MGIRGYFVSKTCGCHKVNFNARRNDRLKRRNLFNKAFKNSTPGKFVHIWLLGHPLFFLRLSSSDRPKFLALKKKKEKKSNEVVTPFFTWNNSFNLKNEHSNTREKNRNKNTSIFHSILYNLLIQICEC